MSQLDARGLPEGYPFNADWEITPRDFKARRDAGERMVLLDVRTSAERATACIAGSVHLPLSEVEGRSEELRPHEDDLIVIHCHHGVRSLRAAASQRDVRRAALRRGARQPATSKRAAHAPGCRPRRGSRPR